MRLILLSTCVILLLLFSLPGCTKEDVQNENPWPSVTSSAKPWSRWWWLGSDVDTIHIKRLIKEYAEAGMGGLEITPIYGVQGRESHTIDFLSPDWMEMLHTSVLSARDHGMEIDMNLGTGWPFGGPQITPDVSAAKLILQHYEIDGPASIPDRIVPEGPDQVMQEATLEVLMAWHEDGTILNLTDCVRDHGFLDWSPATGKWELIAAFCGTTGQQVKRAAPGGEGLTMDHFSRDALEVYLSSFDRAFAGTDWMATASEGTGPGSDPFRVRCFFNDSYEVYGATWTPGFFDLFEQKRGYDLRKYLRELSGIRKTGEEMTARIKSDYRETLSELLLEQFTIPWTQWSHQHGSLTRNQAHGSPGNLIDLYANVDIPECEIFGHRTFDIPGMRTNVDDTRNVEPNPMMLKLASSAAHVTNKTLISNETFTWLGEHFKVALSQCKPEVEEAFLAGINHVFYHGTPYSPEEAAWPGWLFYASVHFAPTNSWWPHLQGLNQYITRCQSVLQSGKADNNILVYWPVYDLWHEAEGLEMMLTVHNIEEWLKYPGIEKMARKGYSYDFVSDRLLKELEAREGILHSAGGKVKYQVLVVPECRFIPLPTLEKILDLARHGAVVVFEQLPSDVPGWGDLEHRKTRLEQLLSSLSFKEVEGGIGKCKLGRGTILLCEEPDRAIAYEGIARERITEFGLKFTRRSVKEGHFYFLVNHSSDPIDAMIPLQYGGKTVWIMDPLDGHFGEAYTENEDGQIRVRVQLRPGESIFLRTFQKGTSHANPWPYIAQRLKPLELTGKCRLTFDEGGPLLPAPAEMTAPAPWTTIEDAAIQEFSGSATYTLTFPFTHQEADDYLLNLGEVHVSARVRLNGHDLGILWSLPFETRVGPYLIEGENRLEIEVANLMANRVRAMDRAAIPWKIFHDINFVNIAYEPFDASGWKIEPSGLQGPVLLIPVLLHFDHDH